MHTQASFECVAICSCCIHVAQPKFWPYSPDSRGLGCITNMQGIARALLVEVRHTHLLSLLKKFASCTVYSIVYVAMHTSELASLTQQ